MKTKSLNERLYNLLSIKSLITIGVVGTFLVLCIMNKEVPASLDTYTGLVIAFYFGTQAEKKFQKEDKDVENKE